MRHTVRRRWIISLLIAVGVSTVTVLARQSAPPLPSTFVYDLSTLGLGVLFQPQHIETDGNPATEEWLIRKVFSDERAVVVVTPTGLCFGPWFTVPGNYHLTERLGRSVYTHLLWPHWDVRAIPHPEGC